MIGAIAGDIIGSVYEHHPIKTKKFTLFDPQCYFTDDTVLTVAVADAILTGSPYVDSIRKFGQRYPGAGYGGTFYHWLFSEDSGPYNSWGNGSAMRVSPVGFAFSTEDEVLGHSRMTAEITHNHPEGIKGAQAVALGVLLARQGAEPAQIKQEITDRFGYDLERTVKAIRPEYSFDVSCQGSVPEAFICFLEGGDWEETVRLAVSLGGDADTQACMAGVLAQARFGAVPSEIELTTRRMLPPHLLEIVVDFEDKYLAG